MPKREDDPTLLGLVIEFDPVEEERRYEEEQEQRRLAKKKLKKKLKKDDSSKCSGATASTSKSNSTNSTSPVPHKIVTTIISEEGSDEEEKSSSSKKEKACQGSEKKEMKKSKSECDLRKVKSKKELNKKELKKAKSKKNLKKEEKRRRRAARNIQRVARGYLVRRDMEEQQQGKDIADRQALVVVEQEEESTTSSSHQEEAPERQEESCVVVTVEEDSLGEDSVGEDSVGKDSLEEESPKQEVHSETPATPPKKASRRLGARIRQAIKRSRPRKEQAASRLQKAFRLFQVRRLFKKGDKQRWRTAWQRFFVFAVLSPSEGMRQKQRLMEGPSVPSNNQQQEEEVSDSTDRDESLEMVPYGPASPVRSKQEEDQKQHSAPDLLDAIPEDKTHCERVDHLLAPLPSFADSDCSINSEELMSDMLSPTSPSTVTTTFTAGSLSPRRVMNNNKPKKHLAAMHSSCPVLRLDTV